MFKSPLLSIIIPIYNVEEYLDDCFHTLQQQSLKDFEIICINDGSTDNSLNIIQTYKNKDERIKIINQPNKGLSAARNAGLMIAQGTYIAFFDPDDSLDSDMYRNMTNIAKDYQVEIVMCGFQTTPNNSIILPNFPYNQKTTPIDFLKYNKKIHSSNDLCFSWRFIFKKDWLLNKGILFNEKIRYAEDMVFNLKAILSAKYIYLINKPLYYYRINNPNSIMKSKYNKYMEESLSIQIQEKKQLIQTFHLDKYTPITKDMSEDIVKRYTFMLFKNALNNPTKTNRINDFSTILSTPYIKEAMNNIGYKQIFSSWKEYIFFLLMKFQCSTLVYKILKKHI